jgi:hypothetical protein
LFGRLDGFVVRTIFALNYSGTALKIGYLTRGTRGFLGSLTPPRQS